MKPLAFIMLLLHVNFSMFIAQIDEMDINDSTGQQVQDINSLTDYIQYAFSNGKQQQKKPDTDDDNARYFHALKPHFFLSQRFVVVKKQSNAHFNRSIPLMDDSKLSAGFFDIQSPPPKA